MAERPIALPPATGGRQCLIFPNVSSLLDATLPRGRQIVERQQLLVREGGVNTAEAIKLLALFEATQAIFEDDLDRLLGEESDRYDRLSWTPAH